MPWTVRLRRRLPPHGRWWWEPHPTAGGGGSRRVRVSADGPVAPPANPVVGVRLGPAHSGGATRGRRDTRRTRANASASPGREIFPSASANPPPPKGADRAGKDVRLRILKVLSILLFLKCSAPLPA